MNSKPLKNALSRKRQIPSTSAEYQSDSSDCGPETEVPASKPKENLRLSDENFQTLQPFLNKIRIHQEALINLERKVTTLTRDLTDYTEPRLTAIRKQPPSLPTPLIHEPEFLANWQASLTKASRKLAKLSVEAFQKQIVATKKDIALQRQQAFSSIEKFTPEEDKKKASTLFPKLVDGQARRIKRHWGPPPAKKRKL